ncbi:MAG: hypothetical protein VB064_14470 [Oscillospiraceae bacterium]|nr:hypothetical protein [Oscillospiraceae bacterium]
MEIFKRIQNKFLSKGEKDRIIVKNMLAAFLIKGGSMFLGLVTMPAYMRYFPNQAVLGVWFTILSVMTWLFIFDFGVGNGLRNKLVDSLVRGDALLSKRLLSSAYIIFTAMAGLFAVLGIIAFQFINWNSVFNITEAIISKSALRTAVTWIFVGVVFQFVLRLITSILYALQKSAATNLLAVITSVLQLCYVLLAPSYGEEKNLLILSCVYIVSTALPLIVATILVFSKQLKNCIPSPRYYDRSTARGLVSLGGVFFLNQMLYMALIATNEFIITRINGAAHVVEYQIYNKPFLLVGSFFSLALTPMWSAVTKAISEKDFSWLRKWYKRLNVLVLLAAFGEFMVVPFLQFFVNIWLGDNTIVINYGYAAAFAGFGSIYIYHSVLSTMVCGSGKLKLQAICYSAGVAVKLLYIITAGHIGCSWIGLIIINSIIFLPYCILQAIMLRKDYSCN